MANQMVHRGPDELGSYLSPDRKVGLGFRRLAIIDLTATGHQPMSNEDGSVWIVFNGEIYNHLELRSDLERRGHKYRGRSDTETILHLYEEEGLECVHKLRGMFAFALWDQRLGRLWLVRDRLGVKPLYYTFQNGKLIFGSEIKAILACPGVKRELDEDALSHYLTFMVTPAPITLFQGIRKLPAGHYLTLETTGEPQITQYWDAICPAADPKLSFEDASQHVRELLDESVRLRMMSDVPFGVFLSGGIDSSGIVALMSRYTNLALNTFSIGFKSYQRYNELEYARQVARTFRTNHTEVIIDDHDAIEYLPRLVYSQDEPIADWVCVPLYFVSRLARESGVIVAQIGEGSDEIFAGYPSYLSRLRLQRAWPTLNIVPRSAWRKGMSVMEVLSELGAGSAERAGRLLRYLAEEDGMYWGNAVVFRGKFKQQLLQTPFWNGSRPADSATVAQSLHAMLDRYQVQYDELQRIIYIELKQRLPELLLMRVDKITMSTSVEGREPYLDHKLVEFVMSLPSSMHLHNNQLKALLKAAYAGVIPDNIIQRKKQGFGAPVSEWFRNELAEEVRSVLLHGRIHERGYFNLEFIRYLLDKHQSGKHDLSTQLWSLYNLFLWYDRWLA